jgi:hypothetical protein
MDAKKEKLKKQQRVIIRAFWIIFFTNIGFFIGGIASDNGLIMCNEHYMTKYYFPMEMQIFFLIILGIVFIYMLGMFIAIGNTTKPKSSNALDQIERLGQLKEKGLISEQEFEIEKKKLWESD